MRPERRRIAHGPDGTGKRPRVFARCRFCSRLRVRGVWLEPEDQMMLQVAGSDHELSAFYVVCDACVADSGRA